MISGEEKTIFGLERFVSLSSILFQDITVSPKIFDEIKEIEKGKNVTIITGGIGGYKRPKV